MYLITNTVINYNNGGLVFLILPMHNSANIIVLMLMYTFKSNLAKQCGVIAGVAEDVHQTPNHVDSSAHLPSRQRGSRSPVKDEDGTVS